MDKFEIRKIIREELKQILVETLLVNPDSDIKQIAVDGILGNLEEYLTEDDHKILHDFYQKFQKPLEAKVANILIRLDELSFKIEDINAVLDRVERELYDADRGTRKGWCD